MTIIFSKKLHQYDFLAVVGKETSCISRVLTGYTSASNPAYGMERRYVYGDWIGIKGESCTGFLTVRCGSFGDSCDCCGYNKFYCKV